MQYLIFILSFLTPLSFVDPLSIFFLPLFFWHVVLRESLQYIIFREELRIFAFYSVKICGLSLSQLYDCMTFPLGTALFVLLSEYCPPFFS